MTPLPFDEEAKLTKKGGAEILAAVAVHVTRLSGERVTGSGAAYDWIGEADHAAAAELVDQPNRILEFTDGRKLNIVSAVRHDFLPHVELQLRQVRQGG